MYQIGKGEGTPFKCSFCGARGRVSRRGGLITIDAEEQKRCSRSPASPVHCPEVMAEFTKIIRRRSTS